MGGATCYLCNIFASNKAGKDLASSEKFFDLRSKDTIEFGYADLSSAFCWSSTCCEHVCSFHRWAEAAPEQPHFCLWLSLRAYKASVLWRICVQHGLIRHRAVSTVVVQAWAPWVPRGLVLIAAGPSSARPQSSSEVWDLLLESAVNCMLWYCPQLRISAVYC